MSCLQPCCSVTLHPSHINHYTILGPNIGGLNDSLKNVCIKFATESEIIYFYPMDFILRENECKIISNTRWIVGTYLHTVDRYIYIGNHIDK